METLTLGVADGIARVHLARPGAGNPVDEAFFAELVEVAAAIEIDSGVRCVLITAEGRLFSVGGDLARLGGSPEALQRFILHGGSDFVAAIAKLHRMRAPVVVAVHALGGARLNKDLVHSWEIDPGLRFRRGRIVANEDPIVNNIAGAYHNRPPPRTEIPNLALAADWVRTDFPSATSEAANESGRLACNAVLDDSASKEEPCPIFDQFRAPQYAAAQKVDEQRYRDGLPNLLDLG